MIVLVVATLIYVATAAPLESGSLGVGTNDAARPIGVPTSPITVRYSPDGRVYMAFDVKNTSLLPVQIRALAVDADSSPYHAARLMIGNGVDADPRTAKAFTPTTLGHGATMGLLIEFAPTSDCHALPIPPQPGASSVYKRLQLRLRVLGLPRTQWVSVGGSDGAFRVGQPNRAQCLGA